MSEQPTEDLGTAFAHLQSNLRRYLRQWVHDSGQAEDLLQEIFMKALISQHKGRPIRNLTGWLYAVARTTLIDYFRANNTSMETISENIPDIKTDDLRLHEELSACLRPFAEQLAPIYRDTLIATDFQGETLRAVAEKQKLSVSAIKSRALRARRMLKEKLLACCHVEMENALVSDYHRISTAGCREKCT